ncbi:MAG: M14 family metallopeptidase [Caldilineaceae bacterium]
MVLVRWVWLLCAGVILLGAACWGEDYAGQTQLQMTAVAPTSSPKGNQRVNQLAAPLVATPKAITPRVNEQAPHSTVLGYSAGGLPIASYTFGRGPQRVVLIGGIHGGAEWNTILLAYAAIDYFAEQPETIPPTLTLQIIPVANPDGQLLTVGRIGRFAADEVKDTSLMGRFNAHGVDLNRNWDCNWNATGRLGKEEISGGAAPFSEKETQILRDFLLKPTPARGVIFWHSAVPGVFAGGCRTRYAAAEKLAEVYANAAGYPYGDAFSYYPVTGDATNWLSLQGIPAIVVELRSHTEVEWDENLAGTLQSLTYLAGLDYTPKECALGACLLP